MFRAALALRPNAWSAVVMLAAVLSVGGAPSELAEAQQDVSAALTEGAAVPDPWRWYWHGDGRLLPAYLAAARQAIP